MKTALIFLSLLLASDAWAGDAWASTWSMSVRRSQHGATLLPSGNILVSGGYALPAGTLASCAVYEPSKGIWSATGAMATARSGHVPVLLRSGKVLVTGATCELYDPTTGTWSATGAMVNPRKEAALVRLDDGRVLAIGGVNSSYTTYFAQCEIYDPTTGSWTVTGSITGLRTNPTATLLLSGKVLMAAGSNATIPMNSCQIWDPSTGLWTATGLLINSHLGHTATMLANGQVLVAGGQSYNAPSELYDPSTGQWSATGTMSTHRESHTATLLPSGEVLVTGGTGGSPWGASCERYSPSTGLWSAAVALSAARYGHSATLLASGQVLVLGGQPDSSVFLSSGELYTPSAGAWIPTQAPPINANGNSLTLLPSGRCLMIGDMANYEYDPVGNSWGTVAPTLWMRSRPTATLLKTGKLLIAGGLLTDPRTEIYDPSSQTFSYSGPVVTVRNDHTATLLPSGKVLITGGQGGLSNILLRQCELYDPDTGTSTATGSMSVPRSLHAAALLPSGKVLVSGGSTADGFTNSCEVYDPLAGTWGPVSSMPTSRDRHTSTVLPNGRVLVVGGRPDGVASAELYEPISDSWSLAGTTPTSRWSHSATVLPSGVVLVAGGYHGSGSNYNDTATCATYDPTTAVWSIAPNMASARSQHGAVVLPSGNVLVAGGNSCERWSNGDEVARRPTVSGTVISPVSVLVSGSGFSPVISGGGGNSGSGPADRPVLQWQRASDGRLWRLSPIGGFTANTTTVIIPDEAAGPGWLRAVVNGIASPGYYVYIDPPAVTLSVSAAIISENGGTASITATLSRAFALPVVVGLQFSGTATPSVDYNLGTNVTVPAGATSASINLTAIPDAVVETGGESVVINVVSVANGTESGTQSATIAITDYQSPGFSVSAISRHTTEAGLTATFTVQPSSPPLFDITLTLASTDSTEGVVSGGASLVFTTGNWTTAQTVTVTGVDDAIDDGNIAYSILGGATSADPDYNNRAMPAVAVINDDDDTAGITIAAPVGFITEGGGSATVGVSLASQPTDNVTLGIVSGTPVQGTVSPPTLSFTAANWNIPQTVTITGADGDGVDNPTAGTNFNLTATVTAGPAFDYPTSVTASRSLTCYPSNAAPAIAAIAPQSVVEDSTSNTVNLSGISAGGGNEAQTLTVTATSSDPTILPNPVATSYTSPGATGSLTLAPVANANGLVTVTVRVSDDATIGRAGATDAARYTETTFTVTVTALNDAPVISGTTAAPWSQAEDDAASAGTLVGAILGGLTISDADAGALRGLAITAAETAHGAWQYNIGAGWNALGTVAEGTARQLADDGVSRVRFVPAGNYNGPAVLTFRAWDRSSGANGALGDATTPGGTTPFSNTTATATVTSTPVNDAPVLAGTTGHDLTVVVGGQANPGTPVAALISTLVSDVDGDPQGIAVVGVSGAGGGGSWQYSTDSGATWGDLSGAGPGAARLLSDAGSMLVRYAPQANEAGTASLVFRAWDRTSGSAGGTANITATGLTTAFSDLAATSTVTVTSGNAAPVVSLPTALLSYTENQAATPLDAAATLTDSDSANFADGSMTVEFILGASSDDRLEVQAIGGVTVSSGTVSVDGTAVAVAGATPLTLAWNAAATPALAQRVLRAVCFRNVSDDPSTAVRIVRVTTSDGDGATSFPTTVTVTVAAVNDAPALTVAGSAGTYVENAAPLPLDASATLADPDSPAFTSGTFSATLQAGGEASDVLAIRSEGTGPGQIAVAAGEVSYGGTVFGTVSGGSGAATPLVVLLGGDASQAAVQALLCNLTFASTSQHPSPTTRTVRLRLTDGAGGISPDADVQVAVQPVNDAPTATVNPWQVNPGVSNSIPAFNLTLSDVDEPPASTLVATITSLPATGTVTIDGATAILGSQFTWQQALETKLRYQAPGAATAVSLSFTIGDGTVAGIGPFTLPITVTDAITNLPPVLVLSGVTTWQESLPPVPVDPNADVSDGDSPLGDQPVLSGGVLTATVTLNGTGAERLSIGQSGGVTLNAGIVAVNGVDVGTVTGGTGMTPLSVALNAAATPARVTRVARAISFAVDSTTPGTATRRVTVQVSDGTSASAAMNADVEVTEVNSPPVVALPRVATAVAEGDGAVVLDSTATCSDADSGNFSGGQMTVTLISGGDGSDRLTLSSVGAISIVADKVNHGGAEIGTWSGGGASPIVVLLNAAATPARVQDLLRAVTGENISDNPVSGTRVVRFSVSDVDGGTGSADLGVYVAAINDAPVVAVSGGAVTWRQGDPPTRIDDLGSVGDVDSIDFAGGRLTASLSAVASATDQLAITDYGSITVVGGTVAWSGTPIGTVTGGDNGTTPLVVALVAAATPAGVQDLLRALAFSAAAVPSEQDRTVAVTVEDGDGGTSTLRSRLVHVVRVNLPPVVTLSGGTAAYTEDQPAVAIDAAATVSDADSADFAGGRLTVTVTDGDADERLSIADIGIAAAQIGVSGQSVTWGGSVIGTWSGGSGSAPLVVELVAPANPAALQGLVQALRYATVSQNPLGTRTVGVVLSDGDGGTSVQATRNVARSGVNDPPVGIATVLTVVDQSATGVWATSDPEGDTFTWSVVQQPTNGTITITNAATGAWSRPAARHRQPR